MDLELRAVRLEEGGPAAVWTPAGQETQLSPVPRTSAVLVKTVPVFPNITEGGLRET